MTLETSTEQTSRTILDKSHRNESDLRPDFRDEFVTHGHRPSRSSCATGRGSVGARTRRAADASHHRLWCPSAGTRALLEARVAGVLSIGRERIEELCASPVGSRLNHSRGDPAVEIALSISEVLT